jgi:hypothetical protein
MQTKHLLSLEPKMHPELKYGANMYDLNNTFFTIAMSPNEKARFAPCCSMVLARAADVLAVSVEVRDRIKAAAVAKEGRDYDPTGLFTKAEHG